MINLQQDLMWASSENCFCFKLSWYVRLFCKYNEHKLPCTQDVLPLCVVKFSSYYYFYCECNCSTVTCPDLRPNLHYFHCCWLFGVQRFQVFVWGEHPISICLSLSFWPFTRQCEVLTTSKLKMKLEYCASFCIIAFLLFVR